MGSIKLLIAATFIAAFFTYSGFVLTIGTAGESIKLDDAAVRGKNVWQKYNCTSCHQIYGLGGYLGPDLTNEISLRGEDYPRVIMQTGLRAMPNFNLTEAEIDDLIAFLKGVDHSGRFPNKQVKFDDFGSLSIPKQ